MVTGRIEDRYGGKCFLVADEVVDVLDPDPDFNGETVLVHGRHTDLDQYILSSSLTPYEEIAEDPEIDWSGIHDYVYEGDE